MARNFAGTTCLSTVYYGAFKLFFCLTLSLNGHGTEWDCKYGVRVLGPEHVLGLLK